MKAIIFVAVMLTVINFAEPALAKHKPNPDDYPLTAHVVASNRTGTDSTFTSYSNGKATYGDIDSTDATVQFRIGNLLYTCGFGCRKHVQVGTDVHAKLEKNTLHVLTGDGHTCDTRIRGVRELPAESK